MNKKELTIRKNIISTALELEKKNLNQGKAGNISVRWNGGILITPSGMDYHKLKPEDIVFIDNKENHMGKENHLWRHHFIMIFWNTKKR